MERAGHALRTLSGGGATAEMYFGLPWDRGRKAAMSTITVAVPDRLDAALAERMKAVGARSKEEYLLGLVEADCAASELERILAERWGGPFEPLADDWQVRVRQAAAQRV